MKATRSLTYIASIIACVYAATAPLSAYAERATPTVNPTTTAQHISDLVDAGKKACELGAPPKKGCSVYTQEYCRALVGCMNTTAALRSGTAPDTSGPAARTMALVTLACLRKYGAE